MNKIYLPQLIAEGIYNSDIAVPNKKISKNRKTTMFEIELPIENTGTSYIDTQKRKISKDTLICSRPNQLRHSEFPYKCYFVHVIIEKGLLFDLLINLPNFITTKKRDYYKKIFKQISKYNQTGIESDYVRVQSLLLELIFSLNKENLNQRSIKHFNDTGIDIIEMTLNYISENLQQDLSLEILSKYVSLSPIYFHNLFKSATGKTLHDYVEEQRIRKSIYLLESTNLTLTQIAYECGFNSQPYFSYVFKRRMKTTPRDYVKKYFELYEK